MSIIKAEYDTETKKVTVFIDGQEVSNVSSCYFYNSSCYCGKLECCCCMSGGACEVSTMEKVSDSGIRSYTRLSANKKTENSKEFIKDLYVEKIEKTPDLSSFFRK